MENLHELQRKIYPKFIDSHRKQKIIWNLGPFPIVLHIYVEI